MSAVGEIGVPAEGHRSGHRHDQLHRPINPFDAPAVAGCVGRPIDQVEHFFGVSQCHDQRPIPPDPFIGYTNAFLTFTVGPSDRSIHIDEGFFQKSLGLFCPDFAPRSVQAFLEH